MLEVAAWACSSRSSPWLLTILKVGRTWPSTALLQIIQQFVSCMMARLDSRMPLSSAFAASAGSGGSVGPLGGSEACWRGWGRAVGAFSLGGCSPSGTSMTAVLVTFTFRVVLFLLRCRHGRNSPIALVFPCGPGS